MYVSASASQPPSATYINYHIVPHKRPPTNFDSSVVFEAFHVIAHHVLEKSVGLLTLMYLAAINSDALQALRHRQQSFTHTRP